jgi:Uma2 family endonuclease
MLPTMNIPVRRPEMSRDAFFQWAATQPLRHEFDGSAPVAMTGGTAGHNLIQQNIMAGLRTRLRGGACRAFGPDAGIATVGDAVRYPDAVVSCATVRDADRLIADPVIVFEVLSPGSGRIDRIVKLREYRAVPSLRRYVLVEHRFVGVTLFSRTTGDAEWLAIPLGAADVLKLPEIAVEMPVDELYQETELASAEPAGGQAPG